MTQAKSYDPMTNRTVYRWRLYRQGVPCGVTWAATAEDALNRGKRIADRAEPAPSLIDDAASAPQTERV